MATKIYLYDADDPCANGTANNFVAEDPKKHSKEGIRGPGDIVSAISKYSGLEWVIFDTHGPRGKSGVLDLAIPFATVNVPLLARCTGSIAPDARILFLGCSVADGPDGRAFLLAVGNTLLNGKGGVVGGSTVGTYTACNEILSLFTDVYLPKFGQLRLISFDKGGYAIKEVFVG